MIPQLCTLRSDTTVNLVTVGHCTELLGLELLKTRQTCQPFTLDYTASSPEDSISKFWGFSVLERQDGIQCVAIHPRSLPVLGLLFTNLIVVPEVGQCWSFDVAPVGPS